MADTKLTGLAQNSTPAAGDYLYIVDNPSGTPASQYITYRDAQKDATVTANTGTSYDIDWSAGSLFELTLTGSPTFTFSNLAAGASVTILLIQDGTGSRTVTWPASVDWPSASAPTLSTGASDVDVITLFCRADGSTVLAFTAGLNMG